MGGLYPSVLFALGVVFVEMGGGAMDISVKVFEFSQIYLSIFAEFVVLFVW